MRWPWSPPRPKPATDEDDAVRRRREQMKQRVEVLAADIKHRADEIQRELERNRNSGGHTPWPRT